jgi:hypothetical protein
MLNRSNGRSRRGYQSGLLLGDERYDSDSDESKPQTSSSKRIYRFLHDSQKREELVWLVNILAFWILILFEYKNLENAYANQTNGDGKTAMIAANTFFGAGKTWSMYFAWTMAVHYVVKFFQTRNDPTLIETINDMRSTILTLQRKQDEALELKQVVPQRFEEDKAMGELSAKVTKLDKKIDKMNAHLQELKLETQGISFQTDRTATLFASRSNGVSNGSNEGIHIEVGRVQQAEDFLNKDDFKSLFEEVTKSYIKNLKQPALESQESYPNKYNIAYLVSLIAAMFKNTKDTFISGDTCRAALTTLLDIAKLVKEASGAKPNYDITKDMLCKAYKQRGSAFNDINDNLDLLEFVTQENNIEVRIPAPRG